MSGQAVLTRTALWSSCDYDFTVGQRYLVYARRNADGSLRTDKCSGNKVLADAQEDLEYAEHLPAPGTGGRIYGQVRRIEQDLLDGRNSLDKPATGVAITLHDAFGSTVEVRSDAEGRFEAVGLKPGGYSISLAVPATARLYYDPPTLELADRVCVPVYAQYQANGRIAGRIVDADGVPARKVRVSAFPSMFTSKREYPNVSIHTTSTDADGRYEIGPLPPGEYHVGVNVEWPAALEDPYPATYFPGVLGRVAARTIAIGEGEMRRASFVLPRKLARMTVSGTVVFADGTAASNVEVHLVAGNVNAISTTRTDQTGAFMLTGLSESTYVVRASFYRSPENNGSAETTILVGDEAVTGVELVLKSAEPARRSTPACGAEPIGVARSSA